MDLSKLSDADLEALNAGKLDQVSDEGLAYLESQTTASSEPPEYKNIVEKGLEAAAPVLDPLARVIDVATLGAPIRAGVAKGVEAFTGEEVAPEKKLLKGQSPSFSEIFEAAGLPSGPALSEVLPGAFSPTGEEWFKWKKGGMFDVTPRDVAGLPLDVATSFGVGTTAKVAKALPGASKVAKALPKKYSLMSAVSGVPREAIETYAKNKSLVGGLDVAAAEDLTQNAANQAKQVVMTARQKAGDALNDAITQSGQTTINAKSLKDILERAVRPPRSALKNVAAQEMYQQMQSKIDDLLTVEQQVPASLQLGPGNILQQVPAQVQRVPISDALTPQQLFDLKQQLKEMGDLYGGRKGLLSALTKKDAPFVDKKFTLALTDAVKQADALIDQATQGASATARNQYAKLSRVADEADRYFSTPEKTFSTLSNISTRAKAPARRIMQTADRTFGTNLEQTGKIIESAKYFNEPAIQPLSGQSITSTSRSLMGTAIGGGVGATTGLPVVGGAAGAVLGGMSVSPAAIKNIYLPLREAGETISSGIGKGAGMIPPGVSPAAAQLWMRLSEELNKQGEQR